MHWLIQLTRSLPRLSQPSKRCFHTCQGVWVVWALDSFADGEQRCVLITSGSRIPRLPVPWGGCRECSRSSGVLGTQDPLFNGQETSKLVIGPYLFRPRRAGLLRHRPITRTVCARTAE